MTFNTSQVILDGFTMDDFIFTMFISGTVTQEDIGKAVSLDTAAPATVKLAADNDVVYGRIFQVEDRSQEGVTTVSVETKFRKRLPKTGAVTIGASVVGAGAGVVKAAAASSANVVLAVGTDYVIVQKN
jgi:hypothetical protein